MGGRAPGDPGSPGPRPAWWVAPGAVVLAGALLYGLASCRPEHAPPPGLSAQVSRDELNAALVGAAAEIGMAVDAQPGRTAPVACTWPGGREGAGESYLLTSLWGPPLQDAPGALETVRAYWTGLGLDVAGAARAGADTGVSGLSGRADDGGVVSLLAGPGGTVLSGESACARPVTGLD